MHALVRRVTLASVGLLAACGRISDRRVEEAAAAGALGQNEAASAGRGATRGGGTSFGGAGTGGKVVGGTPVGGMLLAEAGYAGKLEPSGGAAEPSGGAPAVLGDASVGPSICDEHTRVWPTPSGFVANFENGNDGGWISYSDTVPPNEPRILSDRPGLFEFGGADHVHAEGIKTPSMMGEGAGFGFLAIDPHNELCTDLTPFDGLSFWAKGSSGSDNLITLRAIIPESQPTDANPAGDCMAPGPCSVHPYAVIKLSAAWTHYSIAWTALESPLAKWHGKSIRERAKALIEITHPDFRAELYEYCEKTKWLQHPQAAQTAVSR